MEYYLDTYYLTFSSLFGNSFSPNLNIRFSSVVLLLINTKQSKLFLADIEMDFTVTNQDLNQNLRQTMIVGNN